MQKRRILRQAVTSYSQLATAYSEPLHTRQTNKLAPLSESSLLATHVAAVWW